MHVFPPPDCIEWSERMNEYAGGLKGKHCPRLFLLTSSVLHYTLSTCNITPNQQLTTTDNRFYVSVTTNVKY